MKKLFALLATVVMVTSMFAGIAFAVAPTITWNPLNAAIAVPLNVAPTLTFSAAIRNFNDTPVTPASLLTGITLTRLGVAVPFTAAMVGNVVTVTPAAFLLPDSTYVLSVLANSFEADLAPNTAVAAASITFNTLRTGNAITSFTLPGSVGTQIIPATFEVLVAFPGGTTFPFAAPGLVPTIGLSGGATVAPLATVAQTFPAPLNTVAYTVTSESGVAQVWNVRVVKPWILNATVTGAPAINGTVVIGGTVAETDSATITRNHAIVVQRRAPGAVAWTNAGPLMPILVGGNPLGQFNFAFTFTLAGDYRLALLAANDAAAPVARFGGADAVRSIGSIAGFPLTITTPSANLSWNSANEIRVPLTVIKQAAGGLPVNVVGGVGPAPAGMELGAFTALYNNVAIAPTVVALPALNPSVNPVTGVTTITYTMPGGALATGTLVIDVTDATGNWTGQITINLVARATFNATTAVTAGSLTSGDTATFTTTVFNAAGLDIAAGEYTMTTITGSPLELGVARLRMDGATAGQAATTAAQRLIAPGTITATTILYNATHHELGRVVETFTVHGGLVVNLTSSRVGQTVNLSATVTDRQGRPLNTARVVFTATGTSVPFVQRDAVSGLFPPNPTIANATNTVAIEGWRAVQPAGHAVSNGVYTAEVMLLDTATVDVTVQELQLPAGNYVGAPVWINYPGAMVIRPRLYSVTAAQTTFVTAHPEVLTFTVRDAAGNLVAEPLASLSVVNTTTVNLAPTFAPTQVSPGVWSGLFTAQEPGTVRVRMAGTGDNRVNGIEFTVTVVNPRVEINTSTTRVTSDFFEVVTVRLFDPRNNQPIALPLQVREGRVRTPDRAWRPTANLTLENRPNAAAPWAALGTTGIATGLAATATAAAVPTTTQVRDFDPAAVHEFRVLTWSQQQMIAGVEQPATLRYMASTVEGSLSEHFVQTLTPATVTLSTTEIRGGVANSVAATLRNAHGVAFGSIPAVGAIPAVNREVRASGRWANAFNMPESGVADLIIRPVAGLDGLIAGNILFEVATDRVADAAVAAVGPLPAAQVALRADLRVTAQLDTVAPVITVTAPTTTTEATAQIVINVTDNTAIARDGISFNGVRIENNQVAAFSIVRNVDLAMGANNFVVMAQDLDGNNAVQTITITRTAPPAPPAPPRDTAAPTIEVTAPSVTTEATAMLTIVARDNVAVTGVIFEGASLAVFPAATQTILRTVNLQTGLNSFTLSVVDAAGNVTNRIITIDRRIPAPVVHTITIGRANPAIGLDVPANVRNGRLMVPFRWFAERILNATVDFQVVGAAEIVTLHRGNMHVELTLNSTIAKVNGVPVALDVAPFATGGRTLVPARFLAETFGYIVNWNPVNDEVTFTVRP